MSSRVTREYFMPSCPMGYAVANAYRGHYDALAAGGGDALLDGGGDGAQVHMPRNNLCFPR